MKDAAPDTSREIRRNLDFVLRRRFAFMGDYVAPGSRVLEIGAGRGLTANYLTGVHLIQSDIEPKPGLDLIASGESLPFADGLFDAVICVATLHHLAHPKAALAELSRVLKPGGYALIVESHNSWLLRRLIRLFADEYVDDSIDPFGDEPVRRGSDHWFGNNAVGNLMFADAARFERAFPEFTLVRRRLTECLAYINSGGTDHRTPYLPLPSFMLSALAVIDRWLCAAAPGVFALVQEVVLRRN